MVSFVPNNAGQ
jgi:hypothetical protein